MAAATSSLHLSALLPFPPGLVRRRQRRPPRFSALRFSHPPSQPLRISATQFSVSSLAPCSYEISPFAYLLLLLILPTLPGSWKSLQEFCRRLVGVCHCCWWVSLFLGVWFYCLKMWGVRSSEDWILGVDMGLGHPPRLWQLLWQWLIATQFESGFWKREEHRESLVFRQWVGVASTQPTAMKLM